MKGNVGCKVLISRSSADIALDRIERPDTFQRFRRNRGFLRLMYVEEVPSYMRPTRGFLDFSLLVYLGEARIAVGLENAYEVI